MSVAKWLIPTERQGLPFQFEVIDLEESTDVPSQQALAGLLRDSFWGARYLAGLADRFGWSRVQDRLLSSSVAANNPIARGDFGEAVSVEYLKRVEDYLIPVPKLRYKWTAGQSLPGTDCVAFQIVDGQIVEVAFMECKYRSIRDLAVAVDAAKQLKNGAGESNAELLAFISRRLRAESHPLTELVEAYIFGDSEGQGANIIALIVERSRWDERILTNLQDECIELNPLRVYAAKITGLNDLCESAYSSLQMG